MSPSRSPAALRRLARLHGIQPSYQDVWHRTRDASPDSLIAVLRALHVPISGPGDAPGLVRDGERALATAGLEPVIVAWDGVLSHVLLRSTSDRLNRRVECTLSLEHGETRRWSVDLSRVRSSRPGRHGHVAKPLKVGLRLPSGYHTLSVESAGGVWTSLIVSAPRRAYARRERGWGVFLPLYALRTRASWGAGDFTDVEAMQGWLDEHGSGVFSTLPFQALFLGQMPFDVSPYAPASRLFWNEFYVDPRQAAEFRASRAAQELVESPGFQSEVSRLQASPLVDYPAVMALKRRVLEILAGSLTGRRAHAFRRWTDGEPLAGRYAQFRAVGERRAKAWPDWPEPLRSGTIAGGEFDERVSHYHAYVQWLASEQIDHLAARTRAHGGPGLYLDVPVGVHPQGFDVWQYRELFAAGAAAGAPPDLGFRSGQDWSFPPLDPEAIRRDRYRYVIAGLRHQLARAGSLRIDHVMGLHRLFWIPSGSEPRHGVFVTYPAEELYSILALESHRHQVEIVGENLGTVPRAVNTAMARHGIGQMYVVQYEAAPGRAAVLRPVPAGAVASVNTHDMYPLAGYLEGHDILQQLQTGHLSQAQARRERSRRVAVAAALERFLLRRSAARKAGAGALLRACVEWLGRSAAGLVLVNLEDLWEEVEPQNVPGTGPERPNWRRKARYELEALDTVPGLEETLRLVVDSRASEKRLRR